MECLHMQSMVPGLILCSLFCAKLHRSTIYIGFMCSSCKLLIGLACNMYYQMQNFASLYH